MRDIPGYEGLYAATEDGKIFSYKKKSFIDPHSYTHNGYKQIQLWKNGKATNYKWHRLIAMTFIPNPNNLPQVNHVDENKDNNRVENLEWCTQEHNINHGTRNERASNKNKKRVRCVETGEVFESVNDAAAKNLVCSNTMSQHLHGKHKTCAGKHFKYEVEDK